MRLALAIGLLLTLSACLDMTLSAIKEGQRQAPGVAEKSWDVTKEVADDSADLTTRYYWKYEARDRDPTAQYKLGKNYCCGTGKLFNTKRALKWFCRAARQGQRDAMLEIGKIYETANEEEGSIVPMDKVLAFAFYELAVAHGNRDAGVYRNNAIQRLNDDEKKQAKMYLDKWPHVSCGYRDPDDLDDKATFTQTAGGALHVALSDVLKAEIAEKKRKEEAKRKAAEAKRRAAEKKRKAAEAKRKAAAEAAAKKKDSPKTTLKPKKGGKTQPYGKWAK